MSFARYLSWLMLVTLAACSTPSGGRACGTVEIVSPFVQVAYPAPSASGVPTTGAVVLYYALNSTSAVPLMLTSASGSVVGTVAALPSPLPSPLASPSAAIPSRLSAASFPQLAAATSYAVRYDQTTTSDCAPPATALVTASSFTTR